MEKLFVTYPIALKLEELGFDEQCLASYFVFGDGIARDGKYGQTEPELFIDAKNYLSIEEKSKELNMYAYHVVKVPLYQQVIDWFREKHNMFINVDTSTIKFYKYDVLQPVKYQFFIEDLINRDVDFLYHSGDEDTFYTTYEEAREQAILKTIEICKNNL